MSNTSLHYGELHRSLADKPGNQWPFQTDVVCIIARLSRESVEAQSPLFVDLTLFEPGSGGRGWRGAVTVQSRSETFRFDTVKLEGLLVNAVERPRAYLAGRAGVRKYIHFLAQSEGSSGSVQVEAMLMLERDGKWMDSTIFIVPCMAAPGAQGDAARTLGADRARLIVQMAELEARRVKEAEEGSARVATLNEQLKLAQAERSGLDRTKYQALLAVLEQALAANSIFQREVASKLAHGHVSFALTSAVEPEPDGKPTDQMSPPRKKVRPDANPNSARNSPAKIRAPAVFAAITAATQRSLAPQHQATGAPGSTTAAAASTGTASSGATSNANSSSIQPQAKPTRSVFAKQDSFDDIKDFL